MARSRNQPRGQLALILVAVLALLAMLAVRVDAAPPDDEGACTHGTELDDPASAGDPAVAGDPAPGVDDAGELDLGPWRTRAAPAGMLARIARGAPSLASVIAAAHRAAGLAHDPVPGWRRRSRLAALVPMVTVREGNSESWRDVVDPMVNRGVAFDVRAMWHLDHLVFDPGELRIHAMDVARRRDRRRLAIVTARAYHAWLAASAAAERDERWSLRVADAAAELDALTDGWFSQAIRKQP